MKYMMKFEKNIPMTTSMNERRSSASVAPCRWRSVRRPIARSSSTSTDACQKNRYGEMVVPRTPTRTEKYRADHSTCGMKVARSAVAHAGCAKNARPDVREEHQRQPFEDACDLPIRGEEEEQDDQHAVHRDQDAMVEAGHQLGCLGHASQIGADVDHVGNDQQRAGPPQHRARVPGAHHSREAFARHHPQPCTHQLHGHHERKGKQCDPERRIAKCCAGDRIRGDTGGVVIRRASDEPGAKLGKESFHPRRNAGLWCRGRRLVAFIRWMSSARAGHSRC